MKLFKKVTVAVAMAAVCFTMATPVSASAEASECVHPNLRLVCKQEKVEVFPQEYTVEKDLNGDGRPEEIKYCCYEIVWLERYFRYCDSCEYMENAGIGKATVSHSDRNCPRIK